MEKEHNLPIVTPAPAPASTSTLRLLFSYCCFYSTPTLLYLVSNWIAGGWCGTSMPLPLVISWCTGTGAWCTGASYWYLVHWRLVHWCLLLVLGALVLGILVLACHWMSATSGHPVLLLQPTSTFQHHQLATSSASYTNRRVPANERVHSLLFPSSAPPALFSIGLFYEHGLKNCIVDFSMGCLQTGWTTRHFCSSSVREANK